MKSKKFFKIIWLFLSPVIIMGFFGGAVLWADDTDVWRASAKNNAMMVLDSSGSMSWPVYDETHDYAAFMRWMRDPDGVPATSDAIAEDDGRDGNGSYPFEAANTWWDKDASDPPDEYDRLDPNRIYLVSTFVDHEVITFTDSNGNTQSVSAIADVMWNTGSETSDSSNKRHTMLSSATFLELYDGSGKAWTLKDDTGKVNIETTMVGEEEHVVFPTTVTFVDGYAGAALWDTITNNFAGQTLPNYQDILLTNEVTDDMTNMVTDTGFVGFLKASGFYFSGVFENKTSHIQFVDNHDNAQNANGGYRVYLFATGNFLNFIKLVEDFKVTSGYETCANNLDRTYSTQRYTAWRSVCDKSSGTTGPSWITSSTTIQSHETEYWCDLDCPSDCRHDDADYPDGGTGDFLRGEIDPPGNDTARIKVRFAYIDTDPCGSGTDNDYVELKDAEGNSLLCIKGNQVGPADCTDYKNWNAAVSYDGGVTWQTRVPL
ncbi:MAG: hypothetical protein GY849_06960, partial [Deltaproteobacteria bacterium]|nr:hypothetical protein [Deltaproteobacteria bacterium]